MIREDLEFEQLLHIRMELETVLKSIDDYLTGKLSVKEFQEQFKSVVNNQGMKNTDG
jgi:hypothetical protein